MTCYKTPTPTTNKKYKCLIKICTITLTPEAHISLMLLEGWEGVLVSKRNVRMNLKWSTSNFFEI